MGAKNLLQVKIGTVLLQMALLPTKDFSGNVCVFVHVCVSKRASERVCMYTCMHTKEKTQAWETRENGLMPVILRPKCFISHCCGFSFHVLHTHTHTPARRFVKHSTTGMLVFCLLVPNCQEAKIPPGTLNFQITLSS